MKIGMTFNMRRADRHAATASATCPSGSWQQLADDDEEFDSPETIHALATVLEHLGHQVELLGDGEPMLRRLLDGPHPDLVLNFAEGTGEGRSREARVPAVLEMLGIPYTGSDPLTLAATLDKDCAKRLVAASGVATPAWALFAGDWPATCEALSKLAFPLIVKPAYEGSSKGILASNILHAAAELEDALPKLYHHYQQPVLIEEFIDGDELTVGLVGNGPPDILGIMQVVPRQATTTFIYSLEVKRDWERQVRYECPARLAADDSAAVAQAALAAWSALGCRDVSRIDFRLRGGVPYFLETNPLPGLSPKSGDLVLLAGFVGIDYAELVGRIVQAACRRYDKVRADGVSVSGGR